MSSKTDYNMSDERIQKLVKTAPDWADKPFTTAPELAERLPVTRQAVYKRLQRLVEQEEIHKYKPGRAAIYWHESNAS
jgi:predicted transcriptional regulator